MCGIYGSIESSSRAPERVHEGLRKLEYRGPDSWGLVYPEPSGSLTVSKRTGRIRNISHLPSASLALGHTRWATHGGVTEENAHPHIDCLGKIAVVHNGIIENHESLGSEISHHQNIRSQTDTEKVAHLLEEQLAINGQDLPGAVFSTFPRLDGLNAIAVTDGEQIVAA